MLFYEIWTLFSLFLLPRRIIQCLLSYLIFLYLSILLMHPRLTLLLGCGIVRSHTYCRPNAAFVENMHENQRDYKITIFLGGFANSLCFKNANRLRIPILSFGRSINFRLAEALIG